MTKNQKPREISFGSNRDRRTFPSEIAPNRLGNDYVPENLYQDSNRGPGKYEIEEATRMVNNFLPTFQRFVIIEKKIYTNIL